MKTLRSGSIGLLVEQWQSFLRGQGHHAVQVSGQFDAATDEATRAFQRRHKLDVDGVVGNQTFGKAAMLGFELVDHTEVEAGFPARPDFAPLVSTAERQAMFGLLTFAPAPTASNPEAIRITNDWESANVVKVPIPQLAGIAGAPSSGLVRFHRKASSQLQALWGAWEERGVLAHVLSFGGSYNPRFIRGGAPRQILSNHAFATAFDINVAWNPMGAEPATAGSKGCVYPLVAIAHEFGFYWGGHFSRRDGMHFEIASLR